MSRREWRCFHCNEVFSRQADAAEHFGATQLETPACLIKRHEGHLVHYIRKLEDQLASYRAEDNDIMRSIVVLESEHRQELLRAEETGYNRGVQDMKVKS